MQLSGTHWWQRFVVVCCLVLGLVSWQASASDEVYIDHKHCASHDVDHNHEHNHDDGTDHTGGHHHCPNCSAHFLGLTSTIGQASAVHLDAYRDILADRSLLRDEAPPTPPPNL